MTWRKEDGDDMAKLQPTQFEHFTRRELKWMYKAANGALSVGIAGDYGGEVQENPLTLQIVLSPIPDEYDGLEWQINLRDVFKYIISRHMTHEETPRFDECPWLRSVIAELHDLTTYLEEHLTLPNEGRKIHE